MWRQTYPGLFNAGSLVVAQPRDRAELSRFQRLTGGHEVLDAQRLGALEPDLAGRFGEALFYADEAHMATPEALAFLLEEARRAGCAVELGTPWTNQGVPDDAVVVDCRGMGARNEVAGLRGVRGERVLVETHDLKLARPVRLLHPRHPIYVVPWGDGRFLVGATVIESEDAGPSSVRSALELLGTAYALHPAFGEAAILEVAAGVRPAFADNVPRVIVPADEGGTGARRIYVNGAYRHGFLLGPVLAEAVAGYLLDGCADHPLLRRHA